MKYVDAATTAEKISDKFNIPMAELVDVFAEIPAADVQPADRWISVKDRLPEEAEAEVLVWIEDGTADGIGIYDSLHIAHWYGDDKVFADLKYDEVKGVTHWMYTSAISKPPKDGDKE